MEAVQVVGSAATFGPQSASSHLLYHKTSTGEYIAPRRGARPGSSPFDTYSAGSVFGKG